MLLSCLFCYLRSVVTTRHKHVFVDSLPPPPPSVSPTSPSPLPHSPSSYFLTSPYFFLSALFLSPFLPLCFILFCSSSIFMLLLLLFFCFLFSSVLVFYWRCLFKTRRNSSHQVWNPDNLRYSGGVVEADRQLLRWKRENKRASFELRTYTISLELSIFWILIQDFGAQK